MTMVTAANTHLCAPMLLVVVYAKREHAPALMHSISTQWSMEQDPHTGVHFNAQTGCYMWCFEPPRASDSTIVYLTCDHAADAATGWHAMRNNVQALQALLNNDQQDMFNPDKVIGYSLVYQAEFSEAPATSQPDTMVSAEQWAAIHATVKPLHDDTQQLSTIESDYVPGCGALWLMHVPPHHATGIAIGSVYLALSLPDSDNCLVETVLLSNGPFIMADLIAHKAFYQMREYQRNDGVHDYNESITLLHKYTTALLDEPTPNTTASVPMDVFNMLTKCYDSVTGDVLQLQAMHISLLQQQANYPWWQRHFLQGNSNIASYHWERITTGVRDAELLTAKGKTVLETSSTTVQVLRTRLEQAAERDRQEQKQLEEQRRQQQQEHIATWLAIIGAVLAIPEIVSWDVLCHWLMQRGNITTSCENYSSFEPFWVQLGLVAVVLLVAWLWFVWGNTRRHR